MNDDGMSFDDALREVAQHTVFTTHTPVPAGHDRFDGGLIEEHLGPLRDELGISLRTTDGPGPRRAAQRRRKLLHDRAGPEALAPGQRGESPARPRLAAHVGPSLALARGRRNPHRPHHQRRARAQLAGLADAAALRPQLPGRLAAADGRAGRLAADPRRRSGRTVGNALRPEEPAAGLRPPPRQPAVPPPRRKRRGGRSRRATCSIRTS